MPWGRAILAVLVTLLVVGGIGFIAFAASGAWKPDFGSAPGVNPQDVAVLEQPFEELRAGRDAELIARLAPGIPHDRAQAEIDRIQGLLPAADPMSSRTTFISTTVGTGGNTLYAVREYEFPQHVARTETTLQRSDNSKPWSVAAIHVNVATRQDLAANQVRLLREPPLIQAVAITAIIIPLFILGTFLAALFWRGLKWRWVWLLTIAIGLTTLRVSPATDQWQFSPLAFQLFGASAVWSGSAFDSWVIGVSAPLGAIAFWITRLFQRHEEPATA